MSHSPFHVEDQFYKYAIEHENDPYPEQKLLPSCPHYRRSNNMCLLYNSGYQVCLSFKCRFYKKDLRRDTDCTKCAYYVEGKCRHVNGGENTSVYVASYCCYFRGEEQGQKFHYIRNQISLSLLREKIITTEKAIARQKKYLVGVDKELQKTAMSEEDRKYLETKTCKLKKNLLQKEKELLNLKQAYTKIQSK
jgi:hypothetical protein